MVVCEGETEEKYVELLRMHFRLPIVIKTKVSGNAINQRLLKQYLNELGAEDYKECKVIFIYDADDLNIVNKLNSLSGRIILSNPCMELWYILHSDDHHKPLTSSEIVKQLRQTDKIWKDYKKGELSRDQKRLLIEQMDIACKRAEKLIWIENPSSNLHHFIEDLKREKR